MPSIHNVRAAVRFIYVIDVVDAVVDFVLRQNTYSTSAFPTIYLNLFRCPLGPLRECMSNLNPLFRRMTYVGKDVIPWVFFCEV